MWPNCNNITDTNQSCSPDIPVIWLPVSIYSIDYWYNKDKNETKQNKTVGLSYFHIAICIG